VWGRKLPGGKRGGVVGGFYSGGFLGGGENQVLVSGAGHEDDGGLLGVLVGAVKKKDGEVSHLGKNKISQTDIIGKKNIYRETFQIY